MLDSKLVPSRFHESRSRWVRNLSLEAVKCLIVCRGPVRKEAIGVFEEMGIREFGMLLSEKDSIVYPKCLAPELRDFRFPHNVHRVPDYVGHTAEERRTRIDEIVEIALSNGYSHVFAGYGFMAEDADFIEAIETAGVRFVGPSSSVARRAGAKDEAKKLARSLGASVTPGVDNVSALALLRKAGDRPALERLAKKHGVAFSFDDAKSLEDNAEDLLQRCYGRTFDLLSLDDLQREAEVRCTEIWSAYPGRRIRLKYIGGGGGKGQRVVTRPEDVAAAVMEVCAESKVVAAGSNRNFLIELNIESTRHNEIQLIGNGSWCLSLGGRDCSVQMHEQKLLEVSLTRELLEREIERMRRSNPGYAAALEADARTLAEMEADAERFGAAVRLDSVSTFESIVEADHHYFMEMNTRIQVEHRVTEMVYRLKFANPDYASDVFHVDSLIEAMVLLSTHGEALPKPERVGRHVAGAEVRINATDRSMQPHAGGIIYSWSPPLADEVRDDQGIGTLNPDTGSFVFYNVAGAYDSNVALVITHGNSRGDNLARLREILRRTEIRGYELHTNLQVHYGLLSWMLGHDAMIKPSTQFMIRYLAGIGALEEIVRDVDLESTWERWIALQASPQARETLLRKQTLLMRPIEELLANSHLLGGFVGLHAGRLWREEGGDFAFARNPILFLRDIYHYLNLETDPKRAPSQQIWDHDAAILGDALAFYEEIERRCGIADDWAAICGLFAGGTRVAAIAGDDEVLWSACVAAHAGFQLGLDLLLMIPRIARESGFDQIRMDEKLEPVFPNRFTDAANASDLVKCLSPAPEASPDEIVTPMGGHFYAREAPDLPALVQEGDHFEKGQPLFIVEVMKMFNRILAPCSGTITRELMHDCDGKIVVKGEPIFKIVPDEIHEGESPEVIRERRRAVTRRMMGPLPAG
jgi:acetyl/propionyl-CoA carboxylase alpha subunit